MSQVARPQDLPRRTLQLVIAGKCGARKMHQTTISVGGELVSVRAAHDIVGDRPEVHLLAEERLAIVFPGEPRNEPWGYGPGQQALADFSGKDLRTWLIRAETLDSSAPYLVAKIARDPRGERCGHTLVQKQIRCLAQA